MSDTLNPLYCAALTKAGEQCRNRPAHDSPCCAVHQNQGRALQAQKKNEADRAARREQERREWQANKDAEQKRAALEQKRAALEQKLDAATTERDRERALAAAEPEVRRQFERDRAAERFRQMDQERAAKRAQEVEIDHAEAARLRQMDQERAAHKPEEVEIDHAEVARLRQAEMDLKADERREREQGQKAREEQEARDRSRELMERQKANPRWEDPAAAKARREWERKSKGEKGLHYAGMTLAMIFGLLVIATIVVSFLSGVLGIDLGLLGGGDIREDAPSWQGGYGR